MRGSLWVGTGICVLMGCLSAGHADGKLVTKTIEYKQDGVTFRGYLAYEDTARQKQPGVLVFPEWWGLVEFAKQKAEQLAKMGYVGFAVDMYGDGRTTDNPQEAGKLVGQLKPEQLRQRAGAALEALRKQEMVDPARIGAIGFCFGGKVTLQLAYSGADVRGVVTFHGDLTPPAQGESENIKAQILVCTGADDPMVPMQKIDTFCQGLRGTGVIWQVNLYSGAKHAFTNPGAGKYHLPGIEYNVIAAERSWNAMQQFFREVLAEKPPLSTQPAGR